MGQGYHSKIDGLSQANFMQVEPNSHFWTDLNQLITSLDVNPPDKEYLQIGLNNTIKNGYKLLPVKNIDVNAVKSEIFTSIAEMIEYIRSENYNDKTFYVMLNTTINVGFNLSNGLKLQRNEIYKRINGERDYQDQRWHGCVPDEEKGIAEWINYIEFHLEKAKERVYHLNPDEALAELRKVAALAVRAMEIHGCPERIIPKVSTANDNNLTLKTFTNKIEDK
jgi:hypothetical protein